MTQPAIKIILPALVAFDAFEWLIERGNYQMARNEIAARRYIENHRDDGLLGPKLVFFFSEKEKNLAALFRLTWGGETKFPTDKY